MLICDIQKLFYLIFIHLWK